MMNEDYRRMFIGEMISGIRKSLDILSFLADKRVDPITNPNWYNAESKYQNYTSSLEQNSGEEIARLFRLRYDHILSKLNRGLSKLRFRENVYMNLKAVNLDRRVRYCAG